MNKLSVARSPYLRHAASQRIDWYEWSEEPFEKARSENKPVFLSSGAVWCHWCHVMAKECFEEDGIVGILNDNFINIKLDKDERPDIDRRYQQAVSAMSGSSGWPLSVFLTPDRVPFFGGTYFPPEDAQGRPGFKKVLLTVLDFYRANHEAVAEYTERLLEYLKPESLPPGDITKAVLDHAENSILSEIDLQNGGFGNAPKFPMPGALQFLMNSYFFSKKEETAYAVRKTLEAMAKGGFHDQLGGGFHRYSVDSEWIIPHFEKMAEDNSWLLKNYLDAYCVIGDGYFREVAEGIIRFIEDVLSDPAGGFYASQDADVGPEDEGGYFLWTEGDLKAALTDEEYRILSLNLFHEKGGMGHNPSKRVLFIDMEANEIAEKMSLDPKHVRDVLLTGKNKLLEYRRKRETPFVDKTLYTSINGMCAASFIRAFRVLGDERLKVFGLKSLEMIFKKNFRDNTLYHSEGVVAVLDDYVHLVDGFISAYEVTANLLHLERAEFLMRTCTERLRDNSSGAFFDGETELLAGRSQTVEDMPHPSANSLSVTQLLRLHNITGKELYYELAESALKALAGRIRDLGAAAGSYYCSLHAYFAMLKLNLESSPQSQIARTAVFTFRPYEALAYGEDKGVVTPCVNGVCLEPLSEPDALSTFLKSEQAGKGG